MKGLALLDSITFDVHLTDEDKQALIDFWNVYGPNYEEVTVGLTQGVAENPEYRALFEITAPQRSTESNLTRLERALTHAEWRPYLEYLYTVGAHYAVANVRLATWFSLVNLVRTILVPMIVEAHADDPAKLTSALNGMSKYLEVSMAAIGEAYLQTKEQTILKQREAILELSTPVLPLSEGLLIMPVVGVVDTHRAQQLTQVLLHAIRDHRARLVVMDITGVPVVDSRVANHFIQSIDAARLMGARVVLTGLSPEVAQALVTVGVNLGTITTKSDLQSGIEEAYRRLRYKMIKQRADSFDAMFDDDEKD